MRVNNSEVDSYEQKLTDLIEMTKNVHNFEELRDFSNHYYRFLLMILQRDIPDIDLEFRKKFAKSIIEYIVQLINKKYIDYNNFSKLITKVINATKKIVKLENGVIYARSGNVSTSFNFNSKFAKDNVKHILFHELTHSLIEQFHMGSDIVLSSEEIKKENNSLENLTGNGPKLIKIISISNVNYLLHSMIPFLNEVVAEATACDLANSYLSNKTRTSQSQTLESDWLVPFNRNYQQLGFEFLSTLWPGLSDRKVFKKLAIKAINFEDIGLEIMQIYQDKKSYTWKEDLNEISKLLGELREKTENLELIGEEKINRLRYLISKYKISYQNDSQFKK